MLSHFQFNSLYQCFSTEGLWNPRGPCVIVRAGGQVFFLFIFFKIEFLLKKKEESLLL